MRSYIWSLVVTLMLLAFLAVPGVNSERQASAKENATLDFQLQDLNNRTVTLSSYIDKQPVLLFFWTTSCPYCRKELRIINNRYEELTKESLELLPINIGESAEKVNNFLKKYSLAFRVLLDQDGEVAYSFGLLGVPTYILIDQKGKIVFNGYAFPEREYKKLIHSATP